MLAQPTPFPLPGSYALHQDNGKTWLARIQQRQGDSALISYPTRVGASGNRTIPIGELYDGTPLTDAERAEMNRLSSELRGARTKTPAVKIKQGRLDALRLRDISSRVLADALDAARRERAIV